MGLTIGHGLGIPFSKPKLWSSYWSHQPEVLFFGLYSEIADGKMPNKVTEATDFLTVAGVAGSETYQAPHTAPYEAADTDYIWFKTDASQRTTTTAELIGYDFTRTIVYYGDTFPNAIVAIMILSSDVDTVKMRNDFHLSIWWSGLLSIYGRLKDNRGVGKSTWTAESVFDEKSIDLFDRLLAKGETPTDARKLAIDTFIKAMRADGIWETQFDVFVVTRGKGLFTTKENWIKDAHHALGVNNGGTLVYTEDVGYNAGASTNYGYLRTQFTPSTDGVLFTQNDACFGFKVSGTIGVGQVGHGCSIGRIGYNEGTSCMITSQTGYSQINATSTSLAPYTSGYNNFSRNAASGANSTYFMDDAAATGFAIASTGLVNYEAHILGINVADTHTGRVNKAEVIETYWFGKNLTQANFLKLQTHLNTLFESY